MLVWWPSSRQHGTLVVTWPQATLWVSVAQRTGFTHVPVGQEAKYVGVGHAV